MLNDIESFFVIWKYYLDQNEQITKEDRVKSAAEVEKFNKNELSAMMITETGEI